MAAIDDVEPTLRIDGREPDRELPGLGEAAGTSGNRPYSATNSGRGDTSRGEAWLVVRGERKLLRIEPEEAVMGSAGTEPMVLPSCGTERDAERLEEEVLFGLELL